MKCVVALACVDFPSTSVVCVVSLVLLGLLRGVSRPALPAAVLWAGAHAQRAPQHGSRHAHRAARYLAKAVLGAIRHHCVSVERSFAFWQSLWCTMASVVLAFSWHAPLVHAQLRTTRATCRPAARAAKRRSTSSERSRWVLACLRGSGLAVRTASRLVCCSWPIRGLVLLSASTLLSTSPPLH
jgi:hypothetical protein